MDSIAAEYMLLCITGVSDVALPDLTPRLCSYTVLFNVTITEDGVSQFWTLSIVLSFI
jgi:hypothetical protein